MRKYIYIAGKAVDIKKALNIAAEVVIGLLSFACLFFICYMIALIA